MLLVLLTAAAVVVGVRAPIVPPPTQMPCPTIGTSAFILVTVTTQVDLPAFASLLEYYSKLMPLNSTPAIDFEFHFGWNYSTIVTTNSLEDDVSEWIEDSSYITMLYNSALVPTHDELQTDNSDHPLSEVVRGIFAFIDKENQQPATVQKKKQVVLITDYVPLNVTDVMNRDDNVNTQLLGLYHEIDVSAIDKAANFPVYSVENENLSVLRRVFQGNLDFEFPTIYEAKPLADVFVYMTSMDEEALTNIVNTVIDGPLCQLPATKMYSRLMRVQLAHNNTIWELTMPWIGQNSHSFLKNCIRNLPTPEAVTDNCTSLQEQVVSNFKSTVTNAANLTFVHLFLEAHQAGCFDVVNFTANVRDTTHVRVVTKDDLDDVYDELTLPLWKLGFLDTAIDNQIVHNDMFYLYNYSTTCRQVLPLVPLYPATPWRRPKYLHIALDDMLLITVCATMSVTFFGILIYQKVKRQVKQNQELLNEIMLQPRLYKVAKECPKVARLPWEIKSENVHIDTAFLLGEGTISNVYLGKLKGKAPIMQWIERVEMQQFQDCAVAVRVPRHFDEPEEDQLQREIASMRQLRHHDHIALLLGWTNKADLVCSLLELTHMNLIKYLSQIKETVKQSAGDAKASIPFQTLYKVIWETCDGMAYIHSRNLVHRDLTARNILLTTGLRAKISGFGFCSEPDDPKFAANSLALRYLPIRWLAPECFQGKFSFKSDSWSFGVLMYEIFTLGEQPYEDLKRPEEIISSVRRSRIPSQPKHATKQTYHIMQGCFEMFTSRRPMFSQLKDAFHMQSETSYNNPAFEPDDEF